MRVAYIKPAQTSQQRKTSLSHLPNLTHHRNFVHLLFAAVPGGLSTNTCFHPSVLGHICCEYSKEHVRLSQGSKLVAASHQVSDQLYIFAAFRFY